LQKNNGPIVLCASSAVLSLASLQYYKCAVSINICCSATGKGN